MEFSKFWNSKNLCKDIGHDIRCVGHKPGRLLSDLVTLAAFPFESHTIGPGSSRVWNALGVTLLALGIA